MDQIIPLAWLAAAAGALYALHRLALWMEARGWIYYRRKRGSSGAISAAVLEVQSLLEPSRRHVLEMKRREDEDVEGEESGDPPAERRTGRSR